MKAIIFIFVILIIASSSANGWIDDSILERMNLASYTKCRTDADCHTYSNNSFCFDNDANKIGICKCLESFEMVSRNKTYFACLGPAGYEEPCEKNMQCQLVLSENAECYNSACRCKDGAHIFTDKKCYVSVLLGDYCRTDGNCWMKEGNFGNCVYGRCSCKRDREVLSEDKLSCVNGKKLGELCDNDAECSLIPNTQCRVNCRCTAGYILSRDQTRCLIAATQFSDPCEEDDQCSAFLIGSICKNSICTCPDGLRNIGNRCISPLRIGDSCSITEECIIDSKYSDTINCIGGTCQCLPGTVNDVGCNKSGIIRINLYIILSVAFFILLSPIHFR